MIVALNNKSNLNKQEFFKYIEELNTINTNHILILCPNYLNISNASNTKTLLGSQNVSMNPSGAYTGEISAKDLKSYNVDYSIVGHSERRKYQNETDDEIYEKIIMLLQERITPILCVGETKEERENNKVEEVLNKQLNKLLKINEEYRDKIIIAYEPVWSIGTGVIPTNKEIEDTIIYIKSILPNNKVLYGGSANEENIDTIKQIKIIDGYLLGGLSLNIDKLKEFLDKIN